MISVKAHVSDNEELRTLSVQHLPRTGDAITLKEGEFFHNYKVVGVNHAELTPENEGRLSTVLLLNKI